MYDNVLAKARASSIKSKLFDLALRKKMEEVDRGIVRKDSIWDRLVFKKGGPITDPLCPWTLVCNGLSLFSCLVIN